MARAYSLSHSELLGFDSVCHQGFSLNRCFTFPLCALKGGLLTVDYRGYETPAWIGFSHAICTIGYNKTSLTFLSQSLQIIHVCHGEWICKCQTLNLKTCNMVPSLARLCGAVFLSTVLNPVTVHLSLGLEEFLTTPSHHQVFHTKMHWNVKAMMRSKLWGVTGILIREREPNLSDLSDSQKPLQISRRANQL